METKLTPSSATAGFFQAAPQLSNQYNDDHVLHHLVDTYLSPQPPTHLELSSFADRVIQPNVFALIADAERNPPSISTHSIFGRARTTLHTSYGWRELQSLGIAAGVVADGYGERPGEASRLKQFFKYHLWSGSSAIVTCPSAMTDGAATLLRRQLSLQNLDEQQREVFSDAYRRLVSQDPSEAWTSGQWMTERSGGSDVSGTETVAIYTGDTNGHDGHGMPLGPWTVTGFKWFSSATDSQMTILLAKTEDGVLSAFYAPMRRTAIDGTIETNGVRIQRLKSKMGTRALPTAELVLDGMRAWLVGKAGDGIREISAILNITRIHNAISALGFWGRALAISRAYARVRKVGGALLQDNPTHITALAKNTVKYAAHMHLGFFVVHLLEIVERPESLQQQTQKNHAIRDIAQAKALLRLLTPVAKAQCSKQAIYGIQECMESLGGIGYVEDEQEFNIARLFRDVGVLSIWEGTTDVMADDVVRVIKGRDGYTTCQLFSQWVHTQTSAWHNLQWQTRRALFETALNHFLGMIKDSASAIKIRGRFVLELLTWIVAGILLHESARVSGDGVIAQLATMWLSQRPELHDASLFPTDVERAVVFAEARQRTARL